jgi:hypothetical protein
MSDAAWQVHFNKRRHPDDTRWNSTVVEFWPTLRAGLKSTHRMCNCVVLSLYYDGTTFGHARVVTVGQTVLRSAMLESLQLGTLLRLAVLESLQLDTLLRLAVLESLQLDKQYYVRPCCSRYNWTRTVKSEDTILNFFPMQMSRPNHTSLFRLEPKYHRSGRSDLYRTADDCGAFVE